MFTADQFRAKAAESAESLKHTDVPSEVRRLRRSEQSFNQLAQNEDWLADNFDKIIRSQDDIAAKSPSSRPIAEIEEHILRCLGAAVIMQWNEIPTKLQRELFDTAGSLGDLLKTSALRAQIARFLHNHKDDENSPAAISDKPDERLMAHKLNSDFSHFAFACVLPAKLDRRY
jgi:hypothetical protein